MSNQPYRRRPSTSARRRKRRNEKIKQAVALTVLAVLVVAVIFAFSKLITYISDRDKPSKGTESTQNSTLATSKNPSHGTEKSTENTTQDTTKETESVSKIDKDSWYLMLVNPTHPIKEGFTVELAKLNNGHSVDKRILNDLQQMMDDCRKAGLSPIICSSYRTMEKQTTLYNNQVKYFKNQGHSDAEAKRLAGMETAVPGTSEHQIGLAVDIVALSYQLLDKKQEETAEQKWLMANSYKYGFILRYPNSKSDITKIIYEPWHYRYVGKEVAKEITEKGITLEEYLGILD